MCIIISCFRVFLVTLEKKVILDLPVNLVILVFVVKMDILDRRVKLDFPDLMVTLDLLV